MRVIKFAHTSIGAAFPLERMASPRRADRDWAIGRGSGGGVRVCVVDSGVDRHHPLLGAPADSYGIVERNGGWGVEPDDGGDPTGHGTACAGIIRAVAPECELTSLRVLGGNNRGSGAGLFAGLRWAVEQGFPLISLSLSTQRSAVKEALHDLTDQAYFDGVTFVAAAHNSPVSSYPWRFSSVISVGSHNHQDPLRIETNPNPPVEFFGAGVRIRVAWPDGGTRVVSGNSFATPHITGICARILGEHPEFRTTQLRHVLSVMSDNLEGDLP
ncbi:S8 family serine peptidase [Nocardia sp. NPDC060256]|uniref:S8 family serine peptidase n=1 Tax=unclassified Nocardia TaxID=2637762 RepID=UPI0036657C02